MSELDLAIFRQIRTIMAPKQAADSEMISFKTSAA
jgi:hypothetical protein